MLKTANGNAVDLRNDIQFENNQSTQNDDNSDYDIYMYVNGEQIGEMQYREYRDGNGNPIQLNIRKVKVEDNYQNLGFGQKLYQEFGNIYQSNYNGLPVIRLFSNPLAEYAYKKALSLGWISELSYDEDNIERWYKSKDKQLYEDLRNKLPNQFKGPDWNEI